jgi:hypothetical protein
MRKYITHSSLPVLLVMARLLIVARTYRQGANVKSALLMCSGCQLGWASAYLSLYMFHLYK